MKKKGGRKRTKDQRERDLAELSSMMLQGCKVEEIASRFQVSQRQIFMDIAEVKRRWFAETIENRNEAVQLELERIAERERQLWEQWHRSCEDAEAVKTKTGRSDDDGKPLPDEKTTIVKGQHGSAAIMAEIRHCSDQRCKILGLYAPTQVEATVTHLDMTDDELAEHAQRMGLMPPRLVERMKENQKN